jgi:hypothetical protein
MLARAAVALLLGLSVLLAEKSRPALGNFIGVYWVLGSLLTLRWVSRHRGRGEQAGVGGGRHGNPGRRAGPGP